MAGGGGYQMPGLAPGASVSMAYRGQRGPDVGRDLRLGPFYFRDPDLTEPFLLSRWVLVMPRRLADELVAVRRNGVAAPRVIETEVVDD